MGAIQHGQPGEWARVRGTVLSLWPLFVCFTALGAFAAAFAAGFHADVFAGAFVGTVVATIVFWRRGVRRVESYFKGARGEERVAALLATLPETWHVFHDFAAARCRIDHVVVGPGGVFAIETKNWRACVTDEDGRLLFNGHLPDRDPLVQARREAEAVQAVVARYVASVPVAPVLCFASDAYAAHQKRLGAVTVINAMDLTAGLMASATVLAPHEVTRLAQLMETGR